MGDKPVLQSRDYAIFFGLTQASDRYMSRDEAESDIPHYEEQWQRIFGDRLTAKVVGMPASCS